MVGNMPRNVIFKTYKVIVAPHIKQFCSLNGLVISRLPVIFPNLMCKMSTNHDLLQAKSTVDSRQIEHLGSFADKWWNPIGIFMPLHSMNSLRVPLIRDGLIATKRVNASFIGTGSPLKGTKILDVGCGGGILCEPLARLGAEVTGIDASDELIAVAKAHAQMDIKLKDNLKYIKVTAEEHVVDHREYYDAVVASEVIEHIHDQSFFVKKCVELAKPAGSIFMTTLTKNNMSWLGGIIAAEYILNLVPKGTHDWDLFINPENLLKLFEKYGCQTKLTHGMIYFPFVNKWCWTPNVLINYAIHVVKNPV